MLLKSSIGVFPKTLTVSGTVTFISMNAFTEITSRTEFAWIKLSFYLNNLNAVQKFSIKLLYLESFKAF